jgi:hypothetical protein
MRSFEWNSVMEKESDKKGERPGRGRRPLGLVRETVGIPKKTRADVDKYRAEKFRGKRVHEGSRSAVYVKAIQCWLKWRTLVRLNLPKDLKSQIRGYAEKHERKMESVLIEAIKFAWERRKEWPRPKVPK